MKIPRGMSESEVLEVINRIADRYAYKFRFGYFEAEKSFEDSLSIGCCKKTNLVSSRSFAICNNSG